MRAFCDGVTFPVLVDRDHLLAELLAISNVPTVVWIEGDRRIARPNAAEFGTDTFAEFSGVTAGPHLEAVRRWVRSGEVPDDAATVVADLDADETAARLAFRVAVHLRRNGDTRADAWFARAGELAPHDFTIRRAAMPLTGGDPFGEAFFELYAGWQAAGSPFHGVRRG